MNGDVVGLVALDEVLGFVFGGVVGIAFESHVGNNLLYNNTTNSPCFGVPFNVVTAFEGPGH